MSRIRGIIREVLEFFGAIVALVGIRIAEIAWQLSKLAVFAAILYGGAMEIGGRAPAQWPEASLALGTVWDYAAAGFETLAEAWIAVAVVVLVIFAWVQSSAIRDIESRTGMNLIALVTLLNYLEIETDTEGMKASRENRFLQHLKEGMFASLIFGSGASFDDRLTARATRGGLAATLLNDLGK